MKHYLSPPPLFLFLFKDCNMHDIKASIHVIFATLTVCDAVPESYESFQEHNVDKVIQLLKITLMLEDKDPLVLVTCGQPGGDRRIL